jgi:hypothetical protein
MCWSVFYDNNLMLKPFWCLLCFLFQLIRFGVLLGLWGSPQCTKSFVISLYVSFEMLVRMYLTSFPFVFTRVGQYYKRHHVATPLWPNVGVKPNTSKVGDLESSGIPDSTDQNTLHWGVLGVIEKVLKRRYRKWPCIGHLDICSPSYGQKKGRESNWQFDSRPLKVENQPLPDLQI